MLTGETYGLQKVIACECGQALKLNVLRSAAGYYLGFACCNCGPISRETGYYENKELADVDLNNALAGKDISNDR